MSGWTHKELARTNDADPATTPFTRALTYWADGHLALGLMRFDDKTSFVAWTWPTCNLPIGGTP